ncbi:hypothetical protein [Nocardia aurea]|uniref:hypothetical protein n=1 Tax=Nocardia aurea TaxID=2144174 RepID=UPI0033A4BD64
MSQLPHSARVEALLAIGRAELASPTPGVETAPERPTVPRGDATAADPRRAVLDRIARELLSARQYHAPAVLVADFIDAILAAERAGAEEVRYFVSNVEHGTGGHDSLDAARVELAARRAEIPDEAWHLYAIADVTGER